MGETFRPSLLNVFCHFSTNENETKNRGQKDKVVLKDGGTETNDRGKGNLSSRMNHKKN